MVELTREIWLLRHGATAFSENGLYCGQTDAPLSPLGRRQAHSIRPDIAQVPYQYLWSSDLQRCVETARLAAGEPTLDERLREFDFGDIEGIRFDDLETGTQEALIAFEGFAAPGGETTTEFGERVDGFFSELPFGRHLIVTHGGVIRLLLRESGHDFHVPPGGLVGLSGPSRPVSPET